MNPKLVALFNEWFDDSSDDSGRMSKETCAHFIKSCTGDLPKIDDERVTNLFKHYDSNKDGFIEREEFHQFYEHSARTKESTVRENLKAHNVRPDLKKMSEVEEEVTLTNECMPRFTISRNQEYFDLLIKLLERNDDSSIETWTFIQMLVTNPKIYRNVLELNHEKDKKIDWNHFFDSNSVNKLLYTMQIIEAIMEEGESQGQSKISLIEEKENKY